MKTCRLLVLVGGVLGLLLTLGGCRSPVTTSPNTLTPNGKVTVASDEAACPVLGTVMKKSAMIAVKYHNKTYYMCCQDCVTQFNAHPEKYIQNPAPLTRTMSHE